ncbi:MAG: hypothetical protein CM15mP125_0220 [Gammaproteobacteria bacterium]|nr:MAG: hypothetical protein CM15mP125_0220 [Gammaproteobacteria bacterium]
MQIGGFLAVSHALWVTRGATRVADTCGRVLLRLGPWESVFRFAQQCLVGHGAWIIQRADSLITAPDTITCSTSGISGRPAKAVD